MPAAEVVALLSIFIGLPWVVFAGIAKVKAAGATTLPSGRGSSEIRKSELEAIIGVAVDEVTAPMLRRIEVLEALLTEEDEALDRIDPAVLAGVMDPRAEEHDLGGAARRARA